MANLLDYVAWRGDISFGFSPPNVVDAVIFSQLSYLTLEGIAPSDFSEKKTLSEIAVDVRKSGRKMEHLTGMDEEADAKIVDLLYAAGASERFGGLKVLGYRSIFDVGNVEQFAAVTFASEKINFVAFRGTDNSLIGWKEDFNLGYLDETPSQGDSAKYLKDAMKSLKGDFVVLGHSKGGNDTLYACMKCDAKSFKRIKKIYNFDGPGLTADKVVTDEYKRIKPKLLTVYPERSVVGMMFEMDTENSIVVESEEAVIMQHNAFSWLVMGNALVTKERLKDESLFFHNTFNSWFNDFPKDDVKDFVNTIFDVIMVSETKFLYEFEQNKLRTSKDILLALAGLESKKRIFVVSVIHEFMKAARGNFPLFNIFQNPFIRQSGIMPFSQGGTPKIGES